MSSLPPPWSIVVPMLVYMVLPALTVSAGLMALVERLSGGKQAAAGAALGLMAGVVVGLISRDVLPLLIDGKFELAFTILPYSLTPIPGASTWNRLPWAILAALCVGRVAYLADVHNGDGWLLRGGVACAIAWALIPDETRDKYFWLAPALAAVILAELVILDRLAALPGSSSVAGAVVLSMLVAGGVLLHASSAKLMDVNIVFAVALTGILMTAYGRGVEVGGAMPGVAVTLPCLLLVGRLQVATEIHWTGFALPVVAPLLLAGTIPFSHWPKWRLHALRLVIVLIPLALALYLANDAGSLEMGNDPNGEDDW